MSWRKRLLRLVVGRPRSGDEQVAQMGPFAERLRNMGASEDTVDWTWRQVRDARRRLDVWRDD